MTTFDASYILDEQTGEFIEYKGTLICTKEGSSDLHDYWFAGNLFSGNNENLNRDMQTITESAADINEKYPGIRVLALRVGKCKRKDIDDIVIDNFISAMIQSGQ